MSLTDAIDDRTTSEQLRDLGVEVEKRDAPGLSDATWFRRTNHRGSISTVISLQKNSVAMGAVVAEKIARDIGEDITSMAFGVARLDGEEIMMIQANAKDGHNTKKNKAGTVIVANTSLSQRLVGAGLEVGHYQLAKKIKDLPGGWVAVKK